MIDLRGAATLSARERHALDVLVDLSAVVPCAPTAEASAIDRATRVEFDDAGATAALFAGSSPFVVSPGAVRVPRALLRDVADLMSMDAETMAGERDVHGRPLTTNNALVRAERAQDPIVSRAGSRFAEAVHHAAAGAPVVTAGRWPGGAPFAAALTHDLDAASAWPLFTAMRLLELGRKAHVARAAHVLRAAAASAFTDPIRHGVAEALATEATCSARSTWFIIAGTPTAASFRAGDVTYAPESARVRAILAAVGEAGHEVGLHGSLATVRDGSAFVAQRERLRAIVRAGVGGVRQHFLRRAPGTTERAMSAAGFAYDSTCGFPDRNGFRTGVADVFPLWDDASSQPMALEEAPFCWMDRAQSKYQGIEDPEAWIDEALALCDQCAAVQGLWCGIWHPNLTAALGFPGAAPAFERLVRELAARQAWLAPIGEIVRWRVGRRSLRVTGLRADGAPVVIGDRAALEASPHTYEAGIVGSAMMPVAWP